MIYCIVYVPQWQILSLDWYQSHSWLWQNNEVCVIFDGCQPIELPVEINVQENVRNDVKEHETSLKNPL